MLAYFPTEQLYYLRVHDIIPAAITLPVLGKTVALNMRKLVQASSRFYLAYIFLEFFRLKEQSGLLHAKQRALGEANANSTERVEIKNSWKAHKLAAAYNALRLPGALHWYVVLCGSQFVLSFLFALHGFYVVRGALDPNAKPPKASLNRQAVIVRRCFFLSFYKFRTLAVTAS